MKVSGMHISSWVPKAADVHSESVILNPLNAELNPICHLLALLGAHHILHVSKIRVNAYQCNSGCTKAPECYGWCPWTAFSVGILTATLEGFERSALVYSLAFPDMFFHVMFLCNFLKSCFNVYHVLIVLTFFACRLDSNLRKKLREVPHFEHSFLWCWNLDSWGSRANIPAKF